MKLNLQDLKEAVRGSIAALRLTTKLRPTEHDSAKVFPPTYGADGRADKYAKEKRIVEGQPVDTVLLDSVQSQANRFELALQRAYDEGKLDMPMVLAKFPEEFSDIGRITALEAPHRLADAIFRDSVLINPQGKPTLWRQSE